MPISKPYLFPLPREKRYHHIVSSKTVAGEWTMGTYDNQLQFNYITDTDYDAHSTSSRRYFLMNSDGNLYWDGGKGLICNGTLGASAGTTISGTFDGRIYKNLLIMIRSIANNGNQYSSFVLPSMANTWHFFLPIYQDYYRTAVTITGSGGSMTVKVQMDSNVAGTPAWVYGTA